MEQIVTAPDLDYLTTMDGRLYGSASADAGFLPIEFDTEFFGFAEAARLGSSS